MKAMIFPGQGIQKQGMGRDLYASFESARRIFDTADQISGQTLLHAMFDGQEKELSKSVNAQPAIFVYQVALASAQNSVLPDVVAGHSFGEFAALVVAGSVSFEEAFRLVLTRAALTHDLAEASADMAMAAVIGLADDEVESALGSLSEDMKSSVYVANYNGPGQIVLSGLRAAVAAACAQMKRLGARRAVMLPIEGAFHTPMVGFIGQALEKEIKSLNIITPRIPICQCATASIAYDAETIRKNLVAHPTSPVNWTVMTNSLVQFGAEKFYEVGTDDTLQKIVRRMYPAKRVGSLLHEDCYYGVVRDYSV